ncbi:MAG: sugar phosphate isomerase/epimerase [Oscillospiraceae bacterium]|nr:sugar phosphate isomerase/epimerase [Oscillospiraceae bacterium]
MIAGVSTACLYPKLLEESLYDLALNGISNVEIFINTYSEFQKNFAVSISEILNHFDVNCVSVHPFTAEIEPIMAFSAYERRTNDALEYLKHCFEFMNIINAGIFVLHGNKGSINAPRELFCERYSMMYNLGKKFGITVALENVSRCQSGNLGFLRDLSNMLGDDIKFVLDTKQAVRSKENIFDIINTLKEKIVHVHLSDNGELGDCLMLGKGRLNIPRLISDIYAYNPDVSIILELYRSNFNGISDLTSNYNIILNNIKNIQG